MGRHLEVIAVSLEKYETQLLDVFFKVRLLFLYDFSATTLTVLGLKVLPEQNKGCAYFARKF